MNREGGADTIDHPGAGEYSFVIGDHQRDARSACQLLQIQPRGRLPQADADISHDALVFHRGILQGVEFADLAFRKVQ